MHSKVILSIIFVLAFLLIGGRGLLAQSPGSGGTVNFNGVNQFVDLASFGNLSLPVSVSVWYKPNGSHTEHRIFYSHGGTSGYNGFWLQYVNGNLNVGFGDGSATASFSRRSGHTNNLSFQPNKWYHLTGVIHSANNMEIYIDGNPMPMTYSGTGSTTMSTDNSGGTIARNSAGSIGYLDGQIDELSVWDKALTQQEVRNLMCKKLSGSEPGLLASYRFDGVGPAVVNQKTGGPGGSLISGPSRVASTAPVGDRSFHNYSGNNAVIGFSLSGDSIVIDPKSSSLNGSQLYIVDALPASTNGISLPPGVDYYFGVFNANNNRNYDVELYPGPVSGANPPNSMKLAHRAHNVAFNWTLTTPANNPNIVLPGQNSISQYIIASDPCPPFDFSLGNDTAICPDLPFKIGRPLNSGETYLWSTGESTDSIEVDSSGTYWLRVTKGSGCFEEDSINISYLTVFSDYLPEDSTSCDSMKLEVNGPLKNYVWSNNSFGSNKITVLNSGLVWFEAMDSLTGCTVRDTVDAEILQSSSIESLSLDTVICGADSYTFDITTTNGAIEYLWFDGQTQTSRSFNIPGSFWFERVFPGGCKKRDTLTLSFSPLKDPIAGEDFFLCEDDSVEVELQEGTHQSVVWSNGENGLSTYYSEPGLYWVEVENAKACWQVDSFRVSYKTSLPDLKLFNDTSFCAGEHLVLSAPEGYQVKWPVGMSETYFVGRPQAIKVEVTDGCTKSVEYFEVTQYSCECDVVFPNAFTPNADGLNDFFGPGTKCDFQRFHLQIFNRLGEEIFVSSHPENKFDGRLNGRDLPIGVYTYSFNYSTPSTSGHKRGYFTLIR